MPFSGSDDSFLLRTVRAREFCRGLMRIFLRNVFLLVRVYPYINCMTMYYINGMALCHVLGENKMILDNPNQIAHFRLLTLRQMLKLEMLGMKHSSGKSAYAMIKRELGLKGNKQKVFEQLSEMLGK